MSAAAKKPQWVYEHDRAAAPEATTNGWVRGVYRDAVEYTTSSKKSRGVAFLFGGVLTALGAGFFCWLLLDSMLRAIQNDAHWTDFVVDLPGFIVFSTVGLFALYFFGRLEFFKPLDLPILFDRERRKVYRLVEDLDEKGRTTRRRQVTVIEHDWDDIVAEHGVTTYTTGSSASRQHTLALMVRDKNPGDFTGPITPENTPPYVDGFALGDGKVLTEFSTPRVWEHVRRYMNDNGPALPPGEQLADTSVPVTWWDSLGAVSVFGPGYVNRWRESWGWMLIVHLFSPVMFPLALLMATTNWASYKTAYPVQWPRDVLDKVGPPLSPEHVYAHSDNRASGRRA
ncbi:hypothetical protein EYS42_16420 [Aquabacterium lacunae]|jgi:hypothetical protein|uniref:DUF6708 domain-containing protein n=1 Tax=Aquabacterium lacunae TaxID=2528630 RepID=A0A4Q9GZU1_9BURK|nr:DUF6708 domain-containing protein [Aquabacterium lacunae]TBO27690.1 hypothetical protein EYS42_16420 [Aquabacterium lacunae]